MSLQGILPRMTRPLPTPEQARVGGRLAIRNAVNLFETAQGASQAGNFGAAVALAVLAVEEAAKGRALLGFALSNETGAPFALQDDQFRDLIYRSHPLRHAVALYQGLTAAGLNLLAGVGPDAAEARGQVDRDLRAAAWLSKADRLKQRGLYTDFSDVGWSSPMHITPDRWDEAQAVVRPFLEEAVRQDGVYGLNPP